MRLLMLLIGLTLIHTACGPGWQQLAARTAVDCGTRAVVAGGGQLADQLLDDIDSYTQGHPSFNRVDWQRRAVTAAGASLASLLPCVAAHLLQDYQQGAAGGHPAVAGPEVACNCSHKRHPTARDVPYLAALLKLPRSTP